MTVVSFDVRFREAGVGLTVVPDPKTTAYHDLIVADTQRGIAAWLLHVPTRERMAAA
jgi:hypothetical protein